MQKASRVVGVLMLAASSVYAGQVPGVTAGAEAKAAGETPPAGINLEGVKAFAGGAAPTVPPEGTDNAPIVVESPKPAPGSEGQPVRDGQVTVSDAGTVEIHVVDANLLEVLRMLAAQSQKNIIASKEVRGTVTASLYDVTIKEALDAVLRSNGFTFRERGNFIYVYTAKELQEIEASTRRVQTEVFRLFYTPAADSVSMIKPVLSKQAEVSFTAAAKSGITTGADDVGGNSHATDDVIVVTDYPENLDKVREVLKELDRRPQQILIEATILRAALTEDNALGVDFNLLAGVNFNEAFSQNGQFTRANVADGTAVNTSHGAGNAGTGNNFTNGINNGLRVGFVQDNISVFLAALEGITDTTVLANPKILALNKQKGEVIVGRKDGYLTTTVTASSTVQTVEFLDTGTRLIFRPYIGDDGYIRMEVHPEDSSGGLTANSNLPFKITTEVTSNIMVKDGHTVVIGGLFRESSDSSRNQVPLLGNIPLAGALFRNQRDRTQREEIIIMLTPHVIKDETGYSKEAEKARKDWEKLRTGVRKGMMFTGRERLAEAEYEKAAAEMAKPNPDREKALWHLDAATNLNPKFSEAIAMKEKLTGAELTESDNSSIHGFLRRRVEAESGMAPATQPSSRRLPDTTPKSDVNAATMLESRDFARQQSTVEPTTKPSTVSAEHTPTTKPSVAAATTDGKESFRSMLGRAFAAIFASPKAAVPEKAAGNKPGTEKPEAASEAAPALAAKPVDAAAATPEQTTEIAGPGPSTQPSASTHENP